MIESKKRALWVHTGFNKTIGEVPSSSGCLFRADDTLYYVLTEKEAESVFEEAVAIKVKERLAELRKSLPKALKPHADSVKIESELKKLGRASLLACDGKESMSTIVNFDCSVYRFYLYKVQES